MCHMYTRHQLRIQGRPGECMSPPPFATKILKKLCLALEDSESLHHFHVSPPFQKAAEWSSGKNAGLLRWRRRFKPRMGSLRICNIVFHRQKLCSLAITSDIKLEGALYSAFCKSKLKILDIPEWIGHVPDSQPYHLFISSDILAWFCDTNS